MTPIRTALLPKADALASIAYLALAARGQHIDPTLHQIACAVVQAAPLLELNGEVNGVTTEIEAVRQICERHNWTNKKVVVLDAARPRRHAIARRLDAERSKD